MATDNESFFAQQSRAMTIQKARMWTIYQPAFLLNHKELNEHGDKHNVCLLSSPQLGFFLQLLLILRFVLMIHS
jgi:hypothetical protein